MHTERKGWHGVILASLWFVLCLCFSCISACKYVCLCFSCTHCVSHPGHFQGFWITLSFLARNTVRFNSGFYNSKQSGSLECLADNQVAGGVIENFCTVGVMQHDNISSYERRHGDPMIVYRTLVEYRANKATMADSGALVCAGCDNCGFIRLASDLQNL